MDDNQRKKFRRKLKATTPPPRREVGHGVVECGEDVGDEEIDDEMTFAQGLSVFDFGVHVPMPTVA